MDEHRERGAACCASDAVELFEPRWSDEAEFVALRRASREFLAPWEADLDGEDPFGPERFRRFMARGATRRRFLVRRARAGESGGELVGAVSLSELDRDSGQATLGYWIGAAHARQGLMSAAIELALGFGRRELGVRRVAAYVLPENEPSRGLLRRLGFRCESIAPRYRMVAGAVRDHERWTRELIDR